jgi:hypothetical protein
MLTKNDFSGTDWNTLRDTQYLVGLATAMAGASGLGTLKEFAALTQAIIEKQSSTIPFIRDLTSTAEMRTAQTSLKDLLANQQGAPPAERTRRLALDQTRSAVDILAAKGSKEEKDAYARLLYGIAEKVANAAREGGFLGFGGTQVSEGERSFLNELRGVLQLEEVRTA